MLTQTPGVLVQLKRRFSRKDNCMCTCVHGTSEYVGFWAACRTGCELSDTQLSVDVVYTSSFWLRTAHFLAVGQ